jgi:membrane-bound lytic murein transglycosylase F
MCRTLLLILCSALLTSCGKPRPPTILEAIKHSGELIVVTRNSATTYYEGPQGMTGLEYDLAKLFADRLGVDLRIIVPRSFTDVLPTIINGEAHLAAAALTVTDERQQRVRFGPPYQAITPQLIYRIGTEVPRNLDELNGQLEVVKGSSHAERLRELKEEYPNLSWTENDALESEQLLDLVWEQVIDYTIANSNEVSILQRYYPELRVAFSINSPKSLAWALPRTEDSSLYDEVVKFFQANHADGTLAQLLDRHYGHVQDFDYVGTRRYLAHIESRLPEYTPTFRKAAQETGMDWRMLAAIGYQESHWNAKAQSPTGVRGIMMLTLDTMRQLGLTERLTPENSILGGARYINLMKGKIPERIPEPDRTWLALAAYNIGFGHLEDARILTQAQGGDPDKWVDVQKHLPLLSEKKWYQKARHGYARGREPVRYVENVRSYYDILVWYTESDTPPTAEMPRIPNILPAL